MIKLKITLHVPVQGQHHLRVSYFLYGCAGFLDGQWHPEYQCPPPDQNDLKKKNDDCYIVLFLKSVNNKSYKSHKFEYLCLFSRSATYHI